MGKMKVMLIVNGQPMRHCDDKRFDMQDYRVYDKDKTHIGDITGWQACMRKSGRDVIHLDVKWNTITPITHNSLALLVKHLHGDFYNDKDCSCGCRYFLKLRGDLGYDWGVCANPCSHRAGLLTLEHMGCKEYKPQ